MVRTLLAGAAVAAGLMMPTVAQASISGSSERIGGTNGRVSAIVILNGVTYVGGSFDTVFDRSGHSFTRHNLAAFASNGNPTAWNPNANGAVHALAAHGTRIFAGGAFTAVHCHRAKHLAALGLRGGLAWAGGVGDTVRALRYAGGLVFVGGSFRHVQGLNRHRLASVGVKHGRVTRWNPGANRTVYALATSGTRIYVGGAFTTIGGHTAPHLVDLSQSTGARIRFASHPSYPVLGLAVGGSQLYVAGGGAGGNFAAYSFAGSRLWLHVTDGGAAGVAIAGSQIVFGGHFNAVCRNNAGGGSPFHCSQDITRHHLVAVRSNGALLAWAPPVNSRLGVFAVRAGTNRVWVGGDFTSIGTANRPHLTRFAYS